MKQRAFVESAAIVRQDFPRSADRIPAPVEAAEKFQTGRALRRRDAVGIRLTDDIVAS